MANAQFVTDRQSPVVSTNKVLRNTYFLLSMTLIFSAAMAGFAIASDAPYMGWIPLLVAFGLLFAISKMRNSVWGILLVFAFTGILGYSLGPVINLYLQTPAGTQTVMTAAGLTGVIFLSLSCYTLVTQKDFSYMGGFLMTGLWVVIGCIVLMIFGGLMGFDVTLLNLTISAAIVIIMSGLILYETSQIVHGGETNYIMATVSLYLSIYNLFTSLLFLLGFNDD
ncbi:MAG: Bax inhibitor-1/YccA family protein [Gammaproteobacteria bacterium]|nr:Bax inhibitor-1/YccA family protein [Gammaproteobacteria bacterium]